MTFEVGKSYLFHLGFYGSTVTRCHILAIVDEEYYVYRFWSKHKGWWFYRVEHWIIVTGHYERAQSIKNDTATAG